MLSSDNCYRETYENKGNKIGQRDRKCGEGCDFRVAGKAFSLRRWCLSTHLMEGAGGSHMGEKHSRQREQPMQRL